VIFLATGTPSARVEDGRVILSIPSGSKSRVEIDLTVNQALFAGQTLLKVGCEAMNHSQHEAEIIQFPVGRRQEGRV
jgi:hypothetical protein